jgi:hypothetical protein
MYCVSAITIFAEKTNINRNVLTVCIIIIARASFTDEYNFTASKI